jgi:hypothetical protein
MLNHWVLSEFVKPAHAEKGSGTFVRWRWCDVRVVFALAAYSKLRSLNTDAYRAIADAMYQIEAAPDPQFLVLSFDDGKPSARFIGTPAFIPKAACWVFPLEPLL